MIRLRIATKVDGGPMGTACRSATGRSVCRAGVLLPLLMQLDELTAISPIDGRYRARVAPLAAWFSEKALIRYRLLVELAWFKQLCELPLPELKNTETWKLNSVSERVEAFSDEDALAVKEI